MVIPVWTGPEWDKPALPIIHQQSESREELQGIKRRLLCFHFQYKCAAVSREGGNDIDLSPCLSGEKRENQCGVNLTYDCAWRRGRIKSLEAPLCVGVFISAGLQRTVQQKTQDLV